MDNAALLSPADINVIRRYVQTKYGPLPGGQRAEIVADAIRRTLEQRLPQLPAEMKGRMANELIRRCVLSERREVKPDDVLEVCAELQFPEAESEQIVVGPMLQWMNERTPGLWSEEQLASRLNRRKVVPMVPLPLVEQQPAVQKPPIPEAPTLTITETNTPAAIAADPDQTLFLPRWKTGISKWPKPAMAIGVLVVVCGVAAGMWLLRSPAQEIVVAERPPVLEQQSAADLGMPKELKYREIDQAAVKAYLKGRDALLAEEPYFAAIVESSRNHDVNPLLLLAIVGQEQGFVPKSNKNAKQIANNPFNVFHSWQEYNTDIQDSSDIAARTIARRGLTRPLGHEPFDWFNIKYAEDPNWGSGVKQLFDKLTSVSANR